MNLLKLGERIRSRREMMKLSQVQLAHSLHVSPQAVSKWERGINAPDLAAMPFLSSVLQISLDDLIIGPEGGTSTFPAAVLTTSIRGFAQRAATLSPSEIAVILNSIFQGITSTVLAHKGVPVKYLGDGFLAYFSGQRHTYRAVQSAQQIHKLQIHPDIIVTISEGPIYLGPIGVGDYARPDIIGDAVNLAFLLNQWVSTSTSLQSIGSFLSMDKAGFSGVPVAFASIGDRNVPYVTIAPPHHQ